MKPVVCLLLVALLVGCAAPKEKVAPVPLAPPEPPPVAETAPPEVRPIDPKALALGTRVPSAKLPASLHPLYAPLKSDSPDGRWSVRVQNDGISYSLWILSADGEHGLFGGRGVSISDRTLVLWTPRNTLLFYQMLYGTERDTWFEADPTAGTVSKFLPDVLSGRSAGMLQLSPDGRRLLVSTNLCLGCNKPSENNLTTYVINLDTGAREEVGVDVAARWEGDRLVAVARAPRIGYSGIPTYQEQDEQGVLLVSRPFNVSFQVGAAESAQWRVYRPEDGPGARPLRILPAVNRQDTYNSFGIWWPDPPAVPVRLELWAEVRAGVPEDPALWPGEYELVSRDLRHDGGRRWSILWSQVIRVKDEQPPRQTVLLRSARMSDERNGWGVDWASRILRTADGGLTWRDVSPPGIQRCEGQLFPQQVEAFSANRATIAMACYTTTAEGKWSRESGQVMIFHTTDSGVKWRSASVDTKYDLSRPSVLTFLDDERGWLLVQPKWPEFTDEGALFRTIDGGRTWDKVSDTKTGLPAARAISFLTPDRGWTTKGGAIFVTDDGGRTWQEQPLDRSGFTPGGPVWPEVPGFITPTEGYLTLSGRKEGERQAVMKLFATRDGGRTWEERPEYKGEGRPHFLTPDVGYMWDYELRTLYWTRDGGHTWESKRWEETPTLMTEVYFVDADSGFGVRDHLWVTADGGSTWIPVYPQRAK